MAAKNKSFYNNLDEMPVYNFFKCFEGDLKYMYVLKNGDINETITDKWSVLYDKYCELTYSKKTKEYYKIIADISFLNNRLVFVPLLLDQLLKKGANHCEGLIRELSKWKVNINKQKPIKDEVKKALTLVNNSRNKINRLKTKIDKINENKVELPSIQAQKVRLHKNLNIDINIMTTSVTEWLSYLKEEIKVLKE